MELNETGKWMEAPQMRLSGMVVSAPLDWLWEQCVVPPSRDGLEGSGTDFTQVATPKQHDLTETNTN